MCVCACSVVLVLVGAGTLRQCLLFGVAVGMRNPKAWLMQLHHGLFLSFSFNVKMFKVASWAPMVTGFEFAIIRGLSSALGCRVYVVCRPAGAKMRPQNGPAAKG